VSNVVLEIRGLSKDYRGLRPLRIEHLTLRRGQSLAILGLDAVAAEVLVNLITGATVPDSGEVALFGQLTTSVTDGDAWLASLDRFGIVTERAVLLDQLTVAQNLAVPFSLQLNPVPAAVREKVDRLADDVGLSRGELERQVAEVNAATRLRVRLGRALALAPDVILAEHPNAMVEPGALGAFASDFQRVIASRGCAAVTVTADRGYASSIGAEVLTLHGTSGELRRESAWRRWF
jgi:ABC-type transporter Mla maintaining outer membrane lipid asymmetry ATPase subunit MlaF